MEAKAIVMAMIGFLLLYGGLSACIGIAWYHGKQQGSRNDCDKA